MTLDSKDAKSQQSDGLEIKPLDIVLLLLKYKWMIIAITLAAALIPVVFNIKAINLPSHQQPSIASEYNFAMCKILAKNETGESLAKMLQSAKLKAAMIKNEELIKIMGNVFYDPLNNAWLTKQTLSRDDMEEILTNKLTINREGDTLGIIQYHYDPKVAQQILKYYLLELERRCNELAGDIKMKRLREKDAFIKEITREYNDTKDQMLRLAIAPHIAEALVKKKEIAVASFTAFEIIEPPSINTIPLQYMPKPKQIKGLKIIMLSAAFAFIFSIVLAFFIEYLKVSMLKNPDTIKQIKNYLSWRNRKP